MDATAGELPAATPAPHHPPADWEVRMLMVERMLKAFRFERFAYLGLTFLACGVLLAASARLFANGDETAALSIFGSSGVLALALARMLKMWNQAWKLVAGAGS